MHGVCRQKIIFRPDDGHLLGHGQPRALAGFQHVDRLLVVRRENRQRLGFGFQLGEQPFALVLPLFPVVAISRRLVPSQPGAVVPGPFQGLDETAAAFLVRPVIRVAVIQKIVKSPGQKMLGHQLGGMGMILQYPGKSQLGTAKTEIHGWFFGADDKLRQIIPGAEPGQNPMSFPTPGNHLLPGQIGGKVPVVFLGKFLDPAVQSVVVPSKRDQNPLLLVSHDQSELDRDAGTFQPIFCRRPRGGMRFKPGNSLRNVSLSVNSTMKIWRDRRKGCSIFKQVCNNTGVTPRIGSGKIIQSINVKRSRSLCS